MSETQQHQIRSRVNLIIKYMYPNPKKKTLTPTLMNVFKGLNERIGVILHYTKYQNEKKILLGTLSGHFCVLRFERFGADGLTILRTCERTPTPKPKHPKHKF